MMKMNYGERCKHKNTDVCDNCVAGNLWEDSGNSFALIISAIMFGCGLGGIIAAIYFNI